MDINNTLTTAAIAFSHELRRLRAREDRAASHGYAEDRITFTVTVSGGKPTVELSYGKGYYGNTVKAASLGALMDEVYRRAGFDDREAGRLQAASDALLALPSPADIEADERAFSNEVPF